MGKRNLRFYATMAVVKVMIRGMKLVGKKATNLPGIVAIALCPDILGRIDKPEHIIAVTGTNGKTTVSNMIVDALEGNGYTPVNNRFGGNVDTGIAATLLHACTFTGKIKQQYAVLEIDERSANRIYPYLTPEYLVCTNLSRDSFKRNAHTEFIAGILNQYIPKETTLIVNADDLISSHLAPGNKRVSFGLAWNAGELSVTDNIIRDIVACPACDAPLEYEFIRYNHIGRAHCTNCDYGTIPVDYDAVRRDYQNRTIAIKTPQGEETYRLAGENITDAYNITAAVTLLREFGLSYEQVKKTFDQIKIVESRFAAEEIGGKKLVANLAKGQNPIACSRACDFVRRQPGKKAVILILDDFYDEKTTTENIAWIYETDFEFLNTEDVVQVVAGGARNKDYMVRLRTAGIPKEKIICCDTKEATGDAVNLQDVDSIYVLYDLYNIDSLNVIRQTIRHRIEMSTQGETVNEG